MKLRIITVTVLLIVFTLICCSCGIQAKTVDVKAKLNYMGEVDHNDSFYTVPPEYQNAPEGEKELIIQCQFTNNEKFSVSSLNIKCSNNKNIKTYPGCLDIEPSFPLPPEEQITSCNLYVFVDNNLTDEQILDELQNTTFTFTCENEDYLHHYSTYYFYGEI